MMKNIALSLYTPPFKYHRGYIWDSNDNMVSDNDGQDSIQRIRGWGKISYLPEAEKLQDTLGQMIADALTEYWNKNES